MQHRVVDVHISLYLMVVLRMLSTINDNNHQVNSLLRRLYLLSVFQRVKSTVQLRPTPHKGGEQILSFHRLLPSLVSIPTTPATLPPLLPPLVSHFPFFS